MALREAELQAGEQNKVVYPDIELPPMNLPTEDGVPLESSWHRAAMNLLIESVHAHWANRDDYYVGGNMFVYFSTEQARNRDYKGPDFFVVRGVDGSYQRGSWMVWAEGGHYPNVIVELLSPSTAQADLTTRKDLYEQIFRTTNYFAYDPASQELLGWHLSGGEYVPLSPDENGRLWCEELELWLGLWEGMYLREQATWLRFFTPGGELVPIAAEAERTRADHAEDRAERAEDELERLHARLRAAGIDPEALT